MSLDLSYEELDGYIQQISTGKKITYILNKDEQEVPLLFRYPTSTDDALSKHIYKQALEQAKKEELPSSEEMNEIIKKRGIYTEEDEEKIEKLKSKIEGQQVLLSKITRVPARRDRVKENIRTLEKEIEEIQGKKESALSLTRERKAIENKYLYLTYKGVFDPFTEEPFWKTKETFDEEPDFLFRKRVFFQYVVFSHGLKPDIIRYIARSNLWRIRYVTATKTSDSLFGVPIKDYNIDQYTLLYWSHYYQSIYEMMPDDRPPDTIIEDDQALDAYMKDWQAERNREASASRAKKNNKYGNKSAWDHNETLVMQSNPMHKDVEYSETLAEKAAHSDTASHDAAPASSKKRKSNSLIGKARKGKD